MIQHVAHYRLKKDTSPEMVVEMMRQTRSILLKIPEVLALSAGRNVDPEEEYGFYVSFSVETTDRLKMIKKDAHFLKFLHEVVMPYTAGSIGGDYETDASKDLKFV